jgi:fluoroquinolone resistance protein
MKNELTYKLSSEHWNDEMLHFLPQAIVSLILEYIIVYNDPVFINKEIVIFNHIADFNVHKFSCTNYLNCIFENVDLSSRPIGLRIFLDCEFKNSNLSLTKISRCLMDNVIWIESNLKMSSFISVRNCEQKPASLIFFRSNLGFADFSKTVLSKSRFIDSFCYKTEFHGTNLEGAIFDLCMLVGADFTEAIVQGSFFAEFPKNFLKLLKVSNTTLEFLEKLLTLYLQRILFIFKKNHHAVVEEVLSDIKKVDRRVTGSFLEITPYLSKLNSAVEEKPPEQNTFPLKAYIKFAAICTGLRWPLPPESESKELPSRCWSKYLIQ